jgi:hypothetical protein
MAGQLLAQRGRPSRVIPYQAVGREAIGRTDLSDLSVILLSQLDWGGSPARLRYLVKRLREAAPDATIVIALWSERQLALASEDARAEVGADAYVTSLREVVEWARPRQAALVATA